MAILSPSQLLLWLGQNQFLTSAQVEEFRPIAAMFPDAQSLGRELIRRDWLTPYQVTQILQGKHESLVLDQYRIFERIGEGAMGQVFKARHVRLKNTVAIKTIHKELVKSAKAMNRFRREVTTASSLNHPNIALVCDAGGFETGRPFMVMEFIEGINLSQRVKARGSMPIQEAVEYARQAALGLQQAFEKGIVHRDIKPANLVVAIKDGQPVLKILDFGLARDPDDSNQLTQIGNLLGTVDYVSPEQAQDAHTCDIRADIYSLGCSLFFFMTEQAPFPGESVIERISPRLTGEAPYVRDLRPEVPAGLEAVLRKMMSRRPEDRYQSPVEAAIALQPYSLAATEPLPVIEEVLARRSSPARKGPPAGTLLAEEDEPAHVDEPADPIFLEMTSTGRDRSTAADVRAARQNKKTPTSPKLIWFATGGALVFSLMVCLSSCAFSFYYASQNKKPNSSLHIVEAKLSAPNMKPGDRKFVLVHIKRQEFKGPIKVTLKDDAPTIVTFTQLTIPAGSDKGQLGFTVPYDTKPIVREIRVIAEYEAEGIRAEMPLRLTVIEDPLKGKQAN